MQERRQHARARVILGGTLIFQQRQSTVSSTVRNLSPTGARIVLGHDMPLPELVTFRLDRDGREQTARVAWRRPGEAGLSFLPAARAANDANASTAPIPLDLVRRLRACEAERDALRERLTQIEPQS